MGVCVAVSRIGPTVAPLITTLVASYSLNASVRKKWNLNSISEIFFLAGCV